MKVLFVGPVGAHSGYGSAANDTCMALLAGGAELAISTRSGQELHPRYQALQPCIDAEQGFDPDVVVIYAIPPVLTAVADGYANLGVPLVATTTWETHRMPWQISSDIHARFDKIIACAEFVKKAFVGYEDKVEVIPYAFDPKWWFDSYSIAVGPYSFYWIGTEMEQKNLRGLLIAYLSEFTADDDVHLAIQTPTWNQDEFRRLVQLLGVTNPPDVNFLTGRCSDEDLRALHQEADCYVTLARGEGFGLGAFEAMLAGNHVIATDWSGLKEHVVPGRFCSGNLIPCQLTPAYVPAEVRKIKMPGGEARQVARMGPMGVRADQLWAEPNLMTARAAMRHTYEQRVMKTTQFRGNLVETFGYEAVGAKWLQSLKGLS